MVLTDKTVGYFRQNRPKKLGVYLTFEGAFEAAIQNFAANPKLAALAQGVLATAGAADQKNFDVIRLTQGTSRDVSIEDVLDAVVSVRVGRGHGSGFFVGDDGHIMTNAHVISNSRFIELEKDGDPERYQAQVKFVAHDCDLAILEDERRCELHAL